MARVKISFPEKYLFHTKIPVRITDINYGGHLGNDRLLSLIHEARMQFLVHLGYKGEVEIDGKGIIMSDAAISYKSEVYYGDVLKVDVGVMDINKYGCDIVYKLKKSSDNSVAAIVKTGIVFYDYERKKIVNMPDDFYAKVSV